MSEVHRATPRNSANSRSPHRAWRPVFEALEPRAFPSALFALPLGGGSLVAKTSNDAQRSSVGVHEIAGAVIKINAVGDRQPAAGTAVSGRVTGIAVDPFDADLNAAGGHTWKTKDGGVTWSTAAEPGSAGHIAEATVLPSVTDLIIDRFEPRCENLPQGLATAEASAAA